MTLKDVSPTGTGTGDAMRWDGEAGALTPAETPDIYWPGDQQRGLQAVGDYDVAPGEAVQVVAKVAQPRGDHLHPVPAVALTYETAQGTSVELTMTPTLTFCSCPHTS